MSKDLRLSFSEDHFLFSLKMASAYFTLPSFARAKKNQQELEKQHPREPVLKDEDEKFLERYISREDSADSISTADPCVITDDGDVKQVSEEDQHVANDENLVAVPETKPTSGDEPTGSKSNDVSHCADDPPEQILDAALYASNKNKRDSFKLPSQEEAEAATRNFGVGSRDTGNTDDPSSEKRTWASYIPASMTASFTKKDSSSTQTKPSDGANDPGDQRTWVQYASSYMPSLPSILTNDKDASVEPVYKEDGSIDEGATRAKQEREISVLLDNLNLSSINNRVFAFSEETQKIFDRFALVLKDTMNGGPRAYEDMEKLMKEVGPQIEKQYKAMPPFVRTLVKSLPAKLSTTLAPELLAAASEKPGADLKSKQTESAASVTGVADKPAAQKKKRRIPSLKSLIGKQGAVAGILRNVVNFLRVRFPLLASGTNVVMSLAVFILMFVFWYCHKRGRETRLAREAEASGPADDGDDGEDFESSGSDEEDGTTDDVKAKSNVRASDQVNVGKEPLPADGEESSAVP
nr:hypothetical protein CFP56_63066 [Quercus suber]